MVPRLVTSVFKIPITLIQHILPIVMASVSLQLGLCLEYLVSVTVFNGSFGVNRPYFSHFDVL